MNDQHTSAPTLFYTPGTCAFAGIASMEWMALPYALCRVDREKRSSPAFLRINPHGKVPALRIGDRFLAENSAILLHLAARDPQTRYCPPMGTVSWDELQQWLSYLGSGFHAAFYPYFNPQRYLEDPAGFPALKAAAVLQIRKELAYVDGVLATRSWLLGDAPSLLDPYLFAMTRWAKPFCDLAKDYPSIARHTEALSADPAIQFALAIERGDAGPAPSGALVRHETLLSPHRFRIEPGNAARTVTSPPGAPTRRGDEAPIELACSSRRKYVRGSENGSRRVASRLLCAYAKSPVPTAPPVCTNRAIGVTAWRRPSR